jgi:hypothetical protein
MTALIENGNEMAEYQVRPSEVMVVFMVYMM